MTAPGSHYFDEEPTTESSPRDVTVLLPDLTFTLATDRGVFGYDRIDSGTKLLLLKAPAPATSGDLLDIGCGTGAIAVTMALRSPGATVWAVDVNERARALCRANAERNGADQCAGRAHPTRFPPMCGSRRSGAIPPSASASRRCTRCCCTGSAGWRPTARPCWSCTSTSAATRCRSGSPAQGHPTERLASSAGYRILRTSR